MSSVTQQRPAPDEYAEYYGSYISQVPDVEIIAALEAQMNEVHSVLDRIDENTADSLHGSYAWTIKQVVGHLIDAERIFGVRALRFASSDSQPLPGFDQNRYVDNTDYHRPTLAQLVDEWEYSRRTNVLFFRRIADEAWDRRGTCDGNRLSVRAAAYVLAGHLIHHLKIIRQRVS